MKRNILLLIILIIAITANAQKESEPHIDEIYFTNQVGEKITGKVQVDEKIVLKMDKDEDYFYKKEFLGEGSSIKISIKKDIQKVKLKIYNARKKKHVKRRMKKEGTTKAKDAKKN